MCEEGRDGVYVIGQAGLEEELEGEGIQWKGGTVCLSSSFRGAASNERLVHRGGVVCLLFQLTILFGLACRTQRMMFSCLIRTSRLLHLILR